MSRGARLENLGLLGLLAAPDQPCWSLGNLREAEGTIGLQRAFLAKGPRRLLASVWSVSDAPTGDLMEAFYRHWLTDADHTTAAEPLRRAQHEVGMVAGWEHPRYWAAFQLVGVR